MRASPENNPQPQFLAALPTTVGLGESDQLVRAMTAVLARRRPQSAAEALRVLRQGYPDAPLAMRIAAMSAGAVQSPR
jgi:hypothetical protein